MKVIGTGPIHQWPKQVRKEMRALGEEREELKGLNDRVCYVKIGSGLDDGGLHLAW